MKGCSKFRERLSAYIDRELGPDEARQMEEHLSACAQCSGALEDIKKTIAHLEGLEQMEPPPWLAQKVMARIKEEGIGAERKKFFAGLFSLKPLYVKAPLGALATAMVAITIYFYFQSIIPEIQYRQSESSSPTSEPTTQPGKAAQPQASPKKIIAKKKTESSRIAEPPMTSERPLEDYKIQALPKEEMRAEAGNEAPASAPAAPHGRRYEERERTFRATEYDSAQRQGGSARGKAMSGAVEAPPSKTARLPLAAKSAASFHMVAGNPADAGRQVSDIITRLGGGNIMIDYAGEKTILKAELNAARLREFFVELGKIGPLKERMAPVFPNAGNVTVTVEVSPETPQPADAGTHN